MSWHATATVQADHRGLPVPGDGQWGRWTGRNGLTPLLEKGGGALGAGRQGNFRSASLFDTNRHSEFPPR